MAEQILTTKQKRNEIYQFIQHEIIEKPGEKWQEPMSNLLKDYAKIVRAEQPIIPTKIVIKEKIVYKTKKETEDNYWGL